MSIKITNELIYKVLNNEASESDKDQLQEWINRSDENKKTFLQIERIWQNSNEIAEYYKINENTAWKNIYRNISRKPLRRVLMPFIRVAAIITIAYLLGGLSVYLLKSELISDSEINNTKLHIKAPLGSKTELSLADGTKLWLNSGSEIYYPAVFDKKKREVYLIGEAYFDVEKNKDVPFFVRTDQIDIKVLGTRFNVKAYPEEGLVETTLEEGLINISKKGSEQILQLKPKQKATFVKSEGDILVSDYSLQNLEDLPQKRSEQFVITENVDTEVHTSWKSDKLVFKREKFAALAIKLERWYDVSILVENEKLKEERVTGIFENESIEQALEALKISVAFSYEINKNNVIIK